MWRRDSPIWSAARYRRFGFFFHLVECSDVARLWFGSEKTKAAMPRRTPKHGPPLRVKPGPTRFSAALAYDLPAVGAADAALTGCAGAVGAAASAWPSR